MWVCKCDVKGCGVEAAGDETHFSGVPPVGWFTSQVRGDNPAFKQADENYSEALEEANPQIGGVMRGLVDLAGHGIPQITLTVHVCPKHFNAGVVPS